MKEISEPSSIQNRSLNKNKMQYLEGSSIKQAETSTEIEYEKPKPKPTIQDYLKSLSPMERKML